MPFDNPYYDPNWQDVYDYYDNQRKEMMLRQQEIRETPDHADSDTHVGRHSMELLREEDERLARDILDLNDACNQTFRMQYPTVQGYAEWAFGAYLDSSAGQGGSGLVALPDFEQFRTIGEVDRALLDLDRSIRETAREEREGTLSATFVRAELTQDLDREGDRRSSTRGYDYGLDR